MNPRLPPEIEARILDFADPSESQRYALTNKTLVKLSDVARSWNLIREKGLPNLKLIFCYEHALEDEFRELDIRECLNTAEELSLFIDQIRNIVPNQIQREMFRAIYPVIYNDAQRWGFLNLIVDYGARHDLIPRSKIPTDHWEDYVIGLCGRDDPATFDEQPGPDLHGEEWDDTFRHAALSSPALYRHFETKLTQEELVEVLSHSIFSLNYSETLIPAIDWLLDQIDKASYYQITPTIELELGPVNKVVARRIIEHGKRKGWWTPEAAAEPVADVIGLVFDEYLDFPIAPKTIRFPEDQDLSTFNKVIQVCKRRKLDHSDVLWSIKTTDRFFKACEVLRPESKVLLKFLQHFNTNVILYQDIVEYIKKNKLVVFVIDLINVLSDQSNWWAYKAVEQLCADQNIRIQVPRKFRYLMTLRFGGNYDRASFESLYDSLDDAMNPDMAEEAIGLYPERLFEIPIQVLETILDFLVERYQQYVVDQIFPLGTEMDKYYVILKLLAEREPEYLRISESLLDYVLTTDNLSLFKIMYPDPAEMPGMVLGMAHDRHAYSILSWVASMFDPDLQRVQDI